MQGLREKGWRDGDNLRIEWRSADSRYERIAEIVEELLRQPVDVVVVSGNDMALRSVKVSPRTPVVVAAADFPVEEGLVASLARPGGSITGVSNWVGRDLNAKRLAVLKEAAPAVKRIAIMGPFFLLERGKFLPETLAAARALGTELVRIGADRLEHLDAAFDAARNMKADAIFVSDYPLAFSTPSQRKMSDLAIKYRLPLLQSASTAADQGALLTYAPDIAENFRKAGHQVDKILRGGNPAEIPFEQPARVELVVNLRAARAIGLSIPASLLVQATRIIE